jgi:hypothetical protein
MSKHTSGPWTALAPAPGYRARWRVCTGNELLLKLSLAFNTEANAQLIAAAPELLEACKATWEALDEWATEREPNLEEIAQLREQARQAIAKAEGK